MSEEKAQRDARNIFLAALRDCGIEQAFARKIRRSSDGDKTQLHYAEESLELRGIRYLRIVAVGKASAEMLLCFLAVAQLSAECELRGVLIARDRSVALPVGIASFVGGHPVPTQGSIDGAAAALALVKEAATLEDALCVFLVSGGASSMMELPLSREISLEDTKDFYQLLVHSGASIAEINCIRKHFSAVKGGRLALAAGSTPTLTLLASDVPPQHLDALGSGPTLPDPTTVAECRRLLSEYSLEKVLPEAIRRFFASPALEETPKPGSLHARTWLLLDSEDLAVAAGQEAERLGYHVVFDHGCDDWQYARAAEYLLERIRGLRLRHARVCLISAGEVTVRVEAVAREGDASGEAQLGGRNQHFALYCAALLLPMDEGIAILSAGSDGVDGNSIAAGAIVGRETLATPERLSEGQRALEQFDSFRFLNSVQATIITGPTGNNLRDLRILLAE